MNIEVKITAVLRACIMRLYTELFHISTEDSRVKVKQSFQSFLQITHAFIPNTIGVIFYKILIAISLL